MNTRVIPIVPDQGTAYGRPEPTSRLDLAQVGPRTPMGELLRRYWHPVGLASDATDTPRRLRVLGEDLILFRDKLGRPGLVYPHCAHRGTSLFYGRVEEQGIRCCYHGWLFDVQGNCVEQPCESGGGKHRDKARQPWYPVQEQYGLIWAYMGPPEKKPVLPRYDCLENLDEGEWLETDDSSIGGGGPKILDFNWLQHYENLVDTFHVVILHSTFSGTQFVETLAQMPEVVWEPVELGVQTTQVRKLPDGKTFRRVSQAAVPTIRVIPSPLVGRYGRVESIGWVLPIDDHNFRIYYVGRVSEAGALSRIRSLPDGKRAWHELTDEEHRAFPTDYEAMISQGKIAKHSEEHLATSDRGVVMLRRFMQKQLEIVAQGGDPAGVSFDPDAPLVYFDAGNYLEE